MRIAAASLAALMCSATLTLSAAWAQKDLGPRPGAPGGGGPYLSLSPYEISLFSHAFLRFAQSVSVQGTLEKGKGLGPAFNGNGCAMCHAQPTAGGSSPGLSNPEEPHPNPQVALATLHGASNSVPSFITAQGPVRAARFLRQADGSADGQVHGMYTIAGRSDAGGCALRQPDFAREMAAGNVALRIPTPLYGLGLVENTPDATLEANLAATAKAREKLGIGGAFNRSPIDGSILRFGWKAHQNSLLLFSGEALIVEEGVSNELFPNKREAAAGCVFNATPEDSSGLVKPGQQSPHPGPAVTVDAMPSDIVSFATFIRLLAPPKPAPASPSSESGAKLFQTIGCALCHTAALKAAASSYTGLSEVTYRPYSDFALHHMGGKLADGIRQGAAGPDEFRTAPLWGVGQRLYFLHDGRTADLLQAIREHGSPEGCRAGTGLADTACRSEADGVLQRFKSLSPAQIQDLLNFLRSL